MAINKEEAENLIDNLNELFNHVADDLDPEQRDTLRDLILGDAVGELEDLIVDARAPRMMLLGRTQDGKSSILNALAKNDIAEIGTGRTPENVETQRYSPSFPEVDATWEVFDTRGFFEAETPEEAEDKSPVDILKEEIHQYKPDILLHVLDTSNLADIGPDLEVIEDIAKSVSSMPPIMIVLNKVDNLMDPEGDWPPEKNAKLMGEIGNCLDRVSDLLDIDTEPLKVNAPNLGVTTPDSNEYVGIIPTCAKDGDPRWNVETLSKILGQELPKDAKLDFFQPQDRQDLLEDLADQMINRFSFIAGGIGANPIPFSDITILTPLQWVLIGTIAGLSCRDANKETITEFLSAAGISVGTGMGLKLIAGNLAKSIPGVGSLGGGAINAGIAWSGTQGVGISAKKYYFHDVTENPDDIAPDESEAPDDLEDEN